MTAWKVLVTRATKLGRLLAEPAYRQALRHGVAAGIEHDRTPLAHSYCTIIDVGANRGQFALVASRRFPNARLICFEPQLGPLRVLARVMARHRHLTTVNIALADTQEPSVLHVTQADDSSSLLPVTTLQVATFPGTAVVESVKVTTRRLDDVLQTSDLKRPTLLKIDVQGTELAVIAGAGRLLEQVDTIIVECSFVELYKHQALADDVLSHLRASGFRLVSMMSPSLGTDGTVIQADMVLERDAE